ncbi:hypothetical protein MMC22_002801 [Lobaria immixta]|nr:hypothetical protein [Lobaria immixta]
MWPPNSAKCVKQLKTFNPEVETATTTEESTLPIVARVQPKLLIDIKVELQEWHQKMDKAGVIWSNLNQLEELESFVNASKSLCTENMFRDLKLSLHQKRRQEEL